MDEDEMRKRAEETIASINRQLKKWEMWFPNPESSAEIPRADLLAMAHFARIGLDKKACA